LAQAGDQRVHEVHGVAERLRQDPLVATMAQVITGLPNNGRTQFFNFQYDQALSTARGLDLATDLMNYCDDDMSTLAAWFSGRQLDMSPPINVSVNTVATDAYEAAAAFTGDARARPTKDPVIWSFFVH
jgi:hypothetical protein